MGGNPKGERSVAALMVLVCSARHRELPMSIDRGTIRWRALTPKGANGPIAWDILTARRAHASPAGVVVGREMRYEEIARETSPGVLAPLTPQQRSYLLDLAEMSR